MSLPGPSIVESKPTRRVQRRQWALEVTRSEVEDGLSAAYERADRDGETRWEARRWFGLVQSSVRFEGTGRETRLRYDCHQTARGFRAELAVMAAIIVPAFLTGAPQQAYAFLAPLDVLSVFPSDGAKTAVLAVGVLGIAVATVLNRGPRPRFPTTGLEYEYATFSWYYTVWSFVLVVVVALYVGTVLNQRAVSLLVFLFAYVVSRYATGTLPATLPGVGGETPDDVAVGEAGPPLIDRPFPHLNIAVLALLPTLLTMIAYIVSWLIAPVTPAMSDAPTLVVAAVAASLAVCGTYCFWCRSLLARLRSDPIEPFRSRAGRAVILVGFLAINGVTVLLTAVFVLTLSIPLQVRLSGVDLHYDAVGIGAVLGVNLGLLAVAAGGAAAQRLLARRGGTAAAVGRRLVRYWNYGVLFCLFGALSFLGSNVLGAVAFGDGAIRDPSPRTIRTNFEGYRAVAELASPLPVPDALAYVGLYALLFSPLVLLGVSWGMHVNGKLLDALARRRVSETLATDGRPVPDSAEIRVVDAPVLAAARGRLIGPPTVLVGRALLDELPSEDALDALLAHEAYHLEHLDHAVGALASLSSVLIGGQNVLLAFYDLAESERAADRHAADEVSRTALRSALRTCNRIETDAAIAGTSAGPAFVGSVAAAVGESVTAAGRRFRAVPSPGELRRSVRALAVAPYALLFGSVVYDQAHLDFGDRMDVLALERTVVGALRRETDAATVWFPEEREVTAPVARDVVYDRARAKGATDEQIEATVDALVADGRVREVGDEYLLWRARS
ncbi:M48 family metalloprotease [Halomicrobium salinisoli]|uniref:M48 family metalloprotease n=1 Tax=Halomicrobium salinisoli TaxID=2878391 RepID=UPI001CF08427|nr:M48 family metalloprotease [Halomicrobium salinisoli]